MPQLFAQIPGGQFFMVLFFLALVFAAWTSLVAMIELATRVLIDAGLPRRQAILWVVGAAVVFGSPSALNMDVFQNQDWVWGVGLMLSGLFFAIAAMRFGIEKLRSETVNGEGSDLHIGKWWVFAIGILVPLEALVLMIWWLRDRSPNWLDPFEKFSVGTVLAQWAIALVLLLILNRWLARRSGAGEEVKS